MSTKDRINSLLIKLNIATALAMPVKVNAPDSSTPETSPQNATTQMVVTQNEKDASDKTLSLNDALSQHTQQPGDSLDRAIKDNIRQTGYDIRYDPSANTFGVETANSAFIVFPNEMNYEGISETYLAEQAERYSKPTEYLTDSIGINDVLQEGGCSVAEFSSEGNSITIHKVTMNGKEEAVALVMKKTNCSEHEADSLINMFYKEMTNSDFVESVRTHEESHRDDFEKNLFMPNIPAKYLAKLHCLTEVKATMTQAGRALEQYNDDGRMSHFAPINCDVDTTLLQKDLAGSTFNESPQQHVGKFIFDKWMETYNVEDSPYSTQIANITDGSYFISKSSFIGNHIEDTEEAHQEYLRRVDEMFKDVKYLGDMRGVINPNFELNPQLSKDCSHFIDNGFAPLTKNSQTNKEAYDRINGLLAVVRDCDMDGVRTPQEQTLINQAINELHQKSQKSESSSVLAMRTKIMSERTR